MFPWVSGIEFPERFLVSTTDILTFVGHPRSIYKQLSSFPHRDSTGCLVKTTHPVTWKQQTPERVQWGKGEEDRDPGPGPDMTSTRGSPILR